MLGAIQNLCRTKLEMPTELTGQNGAFVKRNTRIAVTGCQNGLAVSRSVRKRTVTVSVAVPSAGKVVVSGKGLSGGSKSASGRETLMFKLRATRSGKLTTKVKVAFVSNGGGKLSKSLSVQLR